MPPKVFTDIDAVTGSVPFREQKEIGPVFFENIALASKAILIHTGWSEYWNTEKYFEDHPYLTSAAAMLLRDRSVRLVGIDSHNNDNTAQKSRPVHSSLLSNEIFIVEHLSRQLLQPEYVLPLRLCHPK